MRARALVAMGLLGSFGGSACGAHVQEGSSSPPRLQVEAYERVELAASNLGVVVVTLENLTGRSLRVRNVRLAFGAGGRDQGVEVLLGSDLELAVESLRRRPRERPERAALAYLAFGGLVLLAASNGFLTGVHVRGDNRGAEEVEPNPLPLATHLFTPGLVLSPDEVVERWVLVQTVPGRVEYLTTARLELDFEDGSSGAVLVSFRQGCRSAWQRALCR